VADEHETGPSSNIMSTSTDKGPESRPPSPEEENFEAQVNILEQELVPLESSSHDSLLSGERIRIERRLPPADTTHPQAGMPAWAWWSIGAGGLLALAALAVWLARLSV
jgi:hypothetical protein